MRDPRIRALGNTPYAMAVISVCSAMLAVLLLSCSPDGPVQRETHQAEEAVLTAPYSIVFVLHGDGDYLYHDTDGNAYCADEEALAEAQRVAERNPHAEVFIFHQRPRRHFMFLFPLRDGEFFYYRNGRLIAEESYWRDRGQSHFDPELELYRRFRADYQNTVTNVFVYCGHEIPESGGAGYDASYPDRPFTVDALASGLPGFTRDSARFDLMVLSTCFGGTPYTVGTLGSFARYIIASPDNLHLSYFDLHSLERLDLRPHDADVAALAKQFARQAFDRLAGNIQTAVSVAVYDVDRTQEFTGSVRGVYDRTLITVKGETQGAVATMDHCDCADLPAYALPTINEGVVVFYRPAHFGRSKHKLHHSGWECWKERGPQAPPPQTTEPVLK